MCGICGIFNFDDAPVDRELLVRMNNTLAHRGPDAEGYHIEGSIGLGHRRLSIIDLNTGHQPIFNEDKTKSIVFNGEIYNFKDLRERLEAKGHNFATKTDTEVIVHAYEEWGEHCVDYFRGMFAFAIWDRKAETFFLARDRLGIKPLYYAYCDRSLIFGSELKALLEYPRLKREVDLEALSDFLSLGYVPCPKTIFRSVSKLPPGHTLVQWRKGTRTSKYWDVEFSPRPFSSEDHLCKEILEVLDEAVRLRLISDVPLGAFLSGGIDSSLVVALMAKLMHQPVITNTVGFTVEEYSEIDQARAASRMFETNHHEYVVSPDAVGVVEKLSCYFDEPFADSSAIPTYYVSEMTRQNVTVALSGDGGDENFAGYRRYYFDRLENQVRELVPSSLRRNVIGVLAGVYPKADWLPQKFRAKTFLTNVSLDPVSAYFNSMSFFRPSMKGDLLSGDAKKVLNGYDSSEVLRGYYHACSSRDPLSRTQYVDFKTYLVDDILTKVDRASMAHGLEVRVPLLDHKFVELVAHIPSKLKLNGRTSKYLLKKAGRGLLPETILNRKKMGFSVPVGQWLRTELKDMFEETVLSKTVSEKEFFKDSYVKQMWKAHHSGISDFTRPLWALLSFELWARRFL